LNISLKSLFPGMRLEGITLVNFKFLFCTHYLVFFQLVAINNLH